MSDSIYRDVAPLTRAAAENAFESNDAEQIGDALLSVAFHDPDWKWVQDKCLGLIDNESANVRRLAILSLGHLARIHGTLELDKVLPVLDALADNSELSGTVEDALDDIEIFIDKSPNS